MTTELDRRWQLIDKLEGLSEVALQQQDWNEFTQLVNNRLRLLISNCQAIELDEPGFMEYLLSQKDTYTFWATLGFTDCSVVRAIHRGQIDPWANS